MKRRNRLLAALTALLVLQMPLCALACLPVADVTTNVGSTDPSGSPCHEQAPKSGPSEPASSHDDCSCADPDFAVVVSADQKTANPEPVSVLPPFGIAVRIDASPGRVPRAHPKETHLPPPRILLLKSTLLI